MSISKKTFLSFFIASALSVCALALDHKKSTPVEVMIKDMVFSIPDVKIKMGESIKWVNTDLVPHTVTAEDKTFDSKTIDPGKSWIYRPRKIGKFSYKCIFHPTMKAAFSVQ